MNLKEAFRYQNFLGQIMSEAGNSLTKQEHCLTTTKRHLRNKANPEAQDMQEEVDFGEFYKNDDVLDLMLLLVDEREKLSTAIGKAKASVRFDIDAAVETNKFRQIVVLRAKSMLRNSASKRIEQGRDYKFNVEGNQTQYFYDIEVETADAFDRARAKDVAREIMSKADVASAEIDAALINTQVDYVPPFNVNGSFDDVMEEFLAHRAKTST
ncbi:MAG: hypothetical protein NC081_06715 [Roseburia sp.]|nr:hypothetical protein [Roseburia sp.]